MTLRPYQTKLVEDVKLAWQDPSCKPLVVLATGGGKSVILKEIVKTLAHKPVIIIAHRQELVQQLSAHLCSAQVYHKIIAATSVTRNVMEANNRSQYIVPNADVFVASVDTLIARRANLKNVLRSIRTWIVDEAHHVTPQNKWGKAIGLFPALSQGLGLTATPQRTDKKPLIGKDAAFDALIEGPQTAELIATNYLCDYALVAAESKFDRMRLKVGSTGDYTMDSMSKESRRAKIEGDIVGAYLKYAQGKRGVTFVSDLVTAESVANSYTNAGVPARFISGKTPDSVRARFIREFEQGEILQLVNVDILGEGVDVPSIEVVSLARPTMSLIVYLQQIGRSLRNSPGKNKALVIDHVGNFETHGLPDEVRNWESLARQTRQRKNRPTRPLTTCDNCFHVYLGSSAVCPHCNTARKSKGRTPPEQVEGNLQLVDADTLKELRAKMMLGSIEDKRRQATYAAGPVAGNAAALHHAKRIDAQTALAHDIALWAGVRRDVDALSDSEIMIEFYRVFGVDIATSLGMTTKEMEDLKCLIQANLNKTFQTI